MSDDSPIPPTVPVAPSVSPAAPAPPAQADRPGGGVAGRVRRALEASAMRLTLGVGAVLVLFLAGTGYDYEPARAERDLAEVEAALRESPDRDLRRAAGQLRRLVERLQRQVPRGSYVVIDQTHNRIRLMRGGTLVLEAPCSAGSGLVLRESSGSRVWVFDTPRGAFSVLSKIENPVWKKPDWAFVEEGLPIPRDPGERFEYGVLGEYALYFGNGYMIHGTLYERLIGRPVSHGCIRVGREPLREIYRAVPIGAPVYIY